MNVDTGQFQAITGQVQAMAAELAGLRSEVGAVRQALVAIGQYAGVDVDAAAATAYRLGFDTGRRAATGPATPRQSRRRLRVVELAA